MTRKQISEREFERLVRLRDFLESAAEGIDEEAFAPAPRAYAPWCEEIYEHLRSVKKRMRAMLQVIVHELKSTDRLAGKECAEDE